MSKRVALIGSKELSCKILEVLLTSGFEVVMVYTRDDEPGMATWHRMGHRSLKELASNHGLPVREGMKVNSTDSLALLGSLNLDLIVSVFWSEIFKEPLLNLAKLGSFNFHTALLPKNRGSRPIPWALIKGEQYTGITLHKMMTGVDNGPIVDQVAVEIADDDTAGSLYAKVTAAGHQLARQALPQFLDNTFTLTLQDEAQATYQPRGEPYGRQMNPHWPNDLKNRFERAFDFPPFSGVLPAPAHAIHSGKPQVYFAISLVNAAPEVEAKLNFDIPLSLFSSPMVEGSKARTQHEYALYFTMDISARSHIELRKALRSTKGSSAVEALPGTILSDVSTEELSHNYKMLDVLQRAGVGYTSSVHHLVDGAVPQPFRHVNGLLDIPCVAVIRQGSTHSAAVQQLNVLALQQMAKNHRDVFIGLRIEVGHTLEDLSTQIQDIVKEIKSVGGHFITYGEVCAHYSIVE